MIGARHYPHLAARIFNTPLLIAPAKLDAIIGGLGGRLLGIGDAGMQGLIRAIAAGCAVETDQVAADLLGAGMFSTRKGDPAQNGGYRIVDGVAVVGINGALVHRSRMEADSTFLLGYNDITAAVEDAMANSDVHAVLRAYESPGGEVQGAFEHAQRLADLRGKKPMLAIADGVAASAAYLSASAADEIVITGTGYAGSVGVVMRHVDLSRAMEMEGVAVDQIYAGDEKVDGNPFGPLTPAVRARFQAEVEGLYAMLLAAVATYRPKLGIDALRATQARTYRGQAAIEAGLADRLGTTDQLISELAAQRSSRSYGLPARATAQPGGTSMSDQPKPAGDSNQPATHSQADLDRARAEGHAAGLSAGAEAERTRITAILGSTEAEGRMALARQCIAAGLAADQAVALMAAAPKAAVAAAGNPLATAMAALGNPDVKTDAGAAPAADAATLATNMVALYQGGRKN